MIRLFICTAASALALVVPGARAAGTATIDVTGIQAHLIDLDPTDTVLPSVTFDSTGGGSFLRLLGGYGASTVSIEQAGPTAFSSLAGTTGAAPAAGASMSLVGDLFGSGLTAHGAAHTLGGHIAEGSADLQFFRVSRDYPLLPFTLSAHTELMLSGSMSGSVQTDDTNHDVVLSQANFLLSSSPLLGLDDIHVSNLTLRIGGDDGPVTSASREEDVSIALSNDTDAAMTGYFLGYVRVVAGTFPAAVPGVDEPDQALMLVAGAALVAALARWKRRMVRSA